RFAVRESCVRSDIRPAGRGIRYKGSAVRPFLSHTEASRPRVRTRPRRTGPRRRRRERPRPRPRRRERRRHRPRRRDRS
ncbi:hypothetical protein EXE43_27480, partial [Halorubrum sp. SS5]